MFLRRHAADQRARIGLLRSQFRRTRCAADFDQLDAPWLVAVFSSATCTTCADVVAKAKVLSCSEVAVVDVEYSVAPALHRKYNVAAVPIAVIASSVSMASTLVDTTTIVNPS